MRVGAPTITEQYDDVKKIGALLATGFTLDQIRVELKLTRRQLFSRLALMRRRSKDANDVWPKFLAKMEVRYRQFEGIRQRAIQAGKLDAALRAIENMVRLDREIVAVGQELGVYDQVAKETKVTFENPTLGMFHAATYEIEAKDVTPKEGNTATLPPPTPLLR